MNHTTKYLLLFLIVVFGLVIIYDSLTKFGMFEGLENQTAPAATPPVAPSPVAPAPAATPPVAPSPSAPATPPPAAAAAAAAPEKKTASSTKKTPTKTFSF
jgi:hypothetical protein